MNKVDLCSTTKPSKAAGENKRFQEMGPKLTVRVSSSPPKKGEKIKTQRVFVKQFDAAQGNLYTTALY